MEYLPRTADQALAVAIETSPIVVVEGARATGKTTSSARLAASELRLPRDLALLESDPIGVLRRLPRPVLVDEWQLAGIDVLWSLKEIVDADPRPGSFILTGSVEPETFGPTYPLTGRAGRVMWRPMSRRESLGHGADRPWLDRLLAGELFVPGNDSAPTAIDVLSRSGFPGAVQLSDPAPMSLAYADSIAQRALDERRDPTRVARLMRVLAELEASVTPDERIWRSAEINRETFARYDDLLHRTHVVSTAPPWRTNRLKRLTAQSKRYFADTALALAVAGISQEQLESDPGLAGPFLDSFVACQLRSEIDLLRGSLHHLRDKGGDHEVDLVIDIAGKLVAIEIKAGVNPTARDARHLEWLQRQLGETVTSALVVHRGTATWELIPDVWAVPISTMWSRPATNAPPS